MSIRVAGGLAGGHTAPLRQQWRPRSLLFFLQFLFVVSLNDFLVRVVLCIGCNWLIYVHQLIFLDVVYFRSLRINEHATCGAVRLIVIDFVDVGRNRKARLRIVMLLEPLDHDFLTVIVQ